MSKSKKKSNLKHLYILLFIIIVLGVSYYYIEKMEKNTPQNYVPAPLKGEEGKPQYTFVENTDSIKYEAIVIYDENVGINDVAKTFYNDEKFWPYIYLENKSEIINPLNIEKDTVLRIPRLSYISMSIDDPNSIAKTKMIADSILSSTTSVVN